MGESNLVRDLVFDINQVATKLDVNPAELTQAKFLKETDHTSYELRKVGGYRKLINTYFRQNDKDLKLIQQMKAQSSYINKLESIVGNMEGFKEKLIQTVSKTVSKVDITSPVLNKKETQKYLKKLHSKSTKDVARSVVTIWSDHHFGSFVDKEEVANKNEFNWVVGARRLGMLCEQLATYKEEKRPFHEELVVLLVGDIIGGIIHAQEGPNVDLITHQICGTVAYYTQAFTYLRNWFPKIRVICQPGNHGRVMHKFSKDRAVQQKFDSFENIIFYALSQKFASDPSVFFDISTAPYSDVLVQGHRIFTTHGDTVFDTGNVGKVVRLAKIETMVNQINAEEVEKKHKPFEMFCTGHVHHPVFTHVGPGIAVVINGSLIGLDAYAQGIGIHSAPPVQVLWETTKKYVQGDTRKIYVAKADSESKYEQIIQPYKYELVAPKTI